VYDNPIGTYSIYVPLLIITMSNLLKTILCQKPILLKIIPCPKKQTLRNKKKWALLSIATFKTK